MFDFLTQRTQDFTLRMPDGFPSESYDRIQPLFNERFPQQQGLAAGQVDRWREFVFAFNGLRYRYFAADRHSHEYARLLVEHGLATNDLRRCLQEVESFNLLVNSISCLENTYFAAYVALACAANTPFNPRDINIRAEFPAALRVAGPAIVQIIEQDKANPNHRPLMGERDVLSHRGSPSRRFHMGGERNGEADAQFSGGRERPLMEDDPRDLLAHLSQVVTRWVDALDDQLSR